VHERERRDDRPAGRHYPATVLGRTSTWLCLGVAALIAIAWIARPEPRRSGRPAVSAVQRPIDPAYQAVLPWGTYSHWIQPWRAYLDTVPAPALRGAVGINFNVTADEAPRAARLLRLAGVRRARTEAGWGSLDYDDPARLLRGDAAALAARLRALHRNGIRPLIVLNANQGAPCPLRRLDLELVTPAQQGDRTIRLPPASASSIVPRHTGLDAFDGYKAAASIITSVTPDGLARLARPLERSLPAGTYHASTLRYLPFARPYRAEGSTEPNPDYELTLRGWLQYVEAVSNFTKRTLGGTGFDLEIWNELSFGSDFLDLSKYLGTDLPAGAGDVTETMPRATVAWLRDPARGLQHVGITNGFESQRPGGSGANSPPGLTAISKHPYAGLKHFPSAAVADGNRPVNALGHPEGRLDASGHWHQSFVPKYDALFPEWFLTGLQTETLIRDLSPMTSLVYGRPHGRHTHPPGAPAPQLWITEVNLDPEGGDLSTPLPRRSRLRLSEAEQRHVQAKSVLRYLSAYVNKGARAIYLYAAKAGGLSLISPSFFSSAGPQRAISARAGGATMEALQRFTRAFRGPAALRTRRQLSLLRIRDFERRVQFQGDGTTAHPPLYDRDVLAFLPFQVSDRRFVTPVYVMTRDVAKVYPVRGRSGSSQMDMPPEPFDLTIGGLRTCRLHISVLDPLSGARPRARIRSCRPGRLVVGVPVTDSPRLLTLEER
jgi:hypothetical protein